MTQTKTRGREMVTLHSRTIGWPAPHLQRAADAVIKYLTLARLGGDAMVIARIAITAAVRHSHDLDTLVAANARPAPKQEAP